MQLRVLQKLVNGGVGTEIIASNHDMFFLPSYNQASINKWNVMQSDYYWNFIISIAGLLENGIVGHKEIVNLMQEVYLPNLRLISYALTDSKEKITLFAHSPVRAKTVENLVGYLNTQFNEIMRPDLIITYNAKTAQNLADTIDAINNSLRKLFFIDFKKWQEILFSAHNYGSKADANKSPLMCILWNYDQFSRKDEPDFVECIVHGHIGNLGEDGYCVSLDTNLGKFPRDRAYLYAGIDTDREHLHNFECDQYCHFSAIESPFQRLSIEQELAAIDEGIRIAYKESIEIIGLAGIAQEQYINIPTSAAQEGDRVRLSSRLDELVVQRDSFVNRCKHLNVARTQPEVENKFSGAPQDRIEVQEYDIQSVINKATNIKEKVEEYFKLKDLLNKFDSMLKKYENLSQEDEDFKIYDCMIVAYTDKFFDSMIEFLCNKVRIYYSSDTDFSEKIGELQQRCKLSNKEDEVMLIDNETLAVEDKTMIIAELIDVIDKRASLAYTMIATGMRK